ncbi:unnamed protein product, partial [Polarella glacialis]
MRWRLHVAGKPWFTVFYDMTNAFPSTNQECLSNMFFCEGQFEDTPLLQQRHERAYMLVRDAAGGEVLLKTGSGDLQGDRSAPEKFAKIFEPRIQYWQKVTSNSEEKAGTLVAKEPLTGERHDVSLTVF